jgi:hypothetical protein
VPVRCRCAASDDSAPARCQREGITDIDAADADCDAAAATPLDVKPYATMSIDGIMHRTVH